MSFITINSSGNSLEFDIVDTKKAYIGVVFSQFNNELTVELRDPQNWDSTQQSHDWNNNTPPHTPPLNAETWPTKHHANNPPTRKVTVTPKHNGNAITIAPTAEIVVSEDSPYRVSHWRISTASGYIDITVVLQDNAFGD